LFPIPIVGRLLGRNGRERAGPQAETRGAETALYGVLAQIEAHGLKLLEVSYAPPHPGDPSEIA